MTELEQIIAAYWRQPDGAAALDAFVRSPGGEQWRPETVLSVPVFLAHVLDAHEQLAAGLVGAVKGGDPVKVEMVAQALNYSHLRQRVRLMESLVGEQAAASMEDGGADFKALTPSHPVHVDMLWMSFFATAEAEYLDRVVALLAGWLPDPQLQALVGRAASEAAVQQQAMAGLLAKAAQMTLEMQAADCPPVQEALSRRAQARDGLAAAMAARLLAQLSLVSAKAETRLSF
ncbi:hypothetical protein [Magnetospirillum sp. 64-120]|uniref:hypothetical protein n=1 Tax=Magnetospirillum sp. 64-120 TaxID=1895778 RepID=UPI000925E5D6|nr:hypothetical protein [Magnetospirillum sp. 64-120]OJX79248.1 MAG: hypothetical protein BGO92_12175 [Magnetospirillum sp. 64-120]